MSARKLLALPLLAICLHSTTAHAQGRTLYSNVSTYISVAEPGGATKIDGVYFTRMIADELSVNPQYAGQPVSALIWTIGNANSSTVAIASYVTVYEANGSGGGPGTVLYSKLVAAKNVPSDDIVAAGIAAAPGTGFFDVPAGGKFWVGLSMVGGTAALANKFAEGIFGPPLVGSDLGYDIIPAAELSANNPVGARGTGDAFGWYVAGAPEAGTNYLLAGGLGLIGLRHGVRRRVTAAATGLRSKLCV
jgi:hypothetical protein